MKTFASFLFAFASFAMSAVAQLAPMVGPNNVKINKIAPAVLNTPDYSTDVPPKRSEKLKWLEIEVEFEVDKIELVDELTLNYMLMLNGKLYTGQVTHVNIPKGNSRYSVMYMSPRSIDRATDGKQLNSGMIENIWVTIEKQGQKLATRSLANKPVPNVPQVPGMLVPKAETPFQVLWWDRYEAVKVPAR